MSNFDDIYISSWVNDEFAPEGEYDFVSLRMPDLEDWSIIASLEIGFEDDHEDQARVDEIRTILAQKTDDEQEAIYSQARDFVYQTSTGKKCVIQELDERDLDSSFHYFFLTGGFEREESSIILQPEGYDGILSINQNAVDYISIPINRLLKGAADNREE